MAMAVIFLLHKERRIIEKDTRDPGKILSHSAATKKIECRDSSLEHNRHTIACNHLDYYKN